MRSWALSKPLRTDKEPTLGTATAEGTNVAEKGAKVETKLQECGRTLQEQTRTIEAQAQIIAKLQSEVHQLQAAQRETATIFEKRLSPLDECKTRVPLMSCDDMPNSGGDLLRVELPNSNSPGFKTVAPMASTGGDASKDDVSTPMRNLFSCYDALLQRGSPAGVAGQAHATRAGSWSPLAVSGAGCGGEKQPQQEENKHAAAVERSLPEHMSARVLCESLQYSSTASGDCAVLLAPGIHPALIATSYDFHVRIEGVSSEQVSGATLYLVPEGFELTSDPSIEQEKLCASVAACEDTLTRQTASNTSEQSAGTSHKPKQLAAGRAEQRQHCVSLARAVKAFAMDTAVFSYLQPPHVVADGSAVTLKFRSVSFKLTTSSKRMPCDRVRLSVVAQLKDGYVLRIVTDPMPVTSKRSHSGKMKRHGWMRVNGKTKLSNLPPPAHIDEHDALAQSLEAMDIVTTKGLRTNLVAALKGQETELDISEPGPGTALRSAFGGELSLPQIQALLEFACHRVKDPGGLPQEVAEYLDRIGSDDGSDAPLQMGLFTSDGALATQEPQVGMANVGSVCSGSDCFTGMLESLLPFEDTRTEDEHTNNWVGPCIDDDANTDDAAKPRVVLGDEATD